MTKAAELAKMGEVLTNSQIGGRRNIIINGAMQVAQRGTSSTGLGASDGYFTVDRYKMIVGGSAGRFTQSQVSVSDLSGFTKALKLECTTTDTSIASGEYLLLEQSFEGQDVQQLKKGTSEAEEVTISFYVKANANATYVLEMYDGDNARHLSQSFNVTTSWNRIILTYSGDTTGAFDNDNAQSLRLFFWLHSGSSYNSGTISTTWHTTNANRAAGITSFFDSTDRTFFITGLQMEVGSVATPFEHRSFGEELALCQRYFETGQVESAASFITSTVVLGTMFFQTTKRATPTIAYTTDFTLYVEASTPSLSSHTANNIGTTTFAPRAISSSSKNGKAAHIRSGVYTADSEL